MADHRFDRTVFRMMTFKEADTTNIFDKNISHSERLRQAYFLISQAYGFSMIDQPKFDRTHFSSQKQKN